MEKSAFFDGFLNEFVLLLLAAVPSFASVSSYTSCVFLPCVMNDLGCKSVIRGSLTGKPSLFSVVWWLFWWWRESSNRHFPAKPSRWNHLQQNCHLRRQSCKHVCEYMIFNVAKNVPLWRGRTVLTTKRKECKYSVTKIEKWQCFFNFIRSTPKDPQNCES